MKHNGPSGPEGIVSASLTLAYWMFARTFKGPRSLFWRRMTVTGATLGGIALGATPGLRRLRFKRKHLVEGAFIAGGLYSIFSVGDRAARRIMPRGAQQIGDIYELRALESPAKIMLRLATIVGPAEELYWRGFVQNRLGGGHTPERSVALGTAAYAGAHLITGNPTLLGAAAVAGAYWGALYEAGIDLESLIVSHVLWDAVIFLFRPTSASRQALTEPPP